jgi:hypothetical protein
VLCPADPNVMVFDESLLIIIHGKSIHISC